MSRLDVERFLDFRVRRNEEVEDDNGGYEKREEDIWIALAMNRG